MKIKLDENLPFGLVSILSELGHEIDTIPEEGLKGCNDEQVWEAAQKSGRFLITQDLNFSNINLFKPGTPFKRSFNRKKWSAGKVVSSL